jgi:predicted TIM-barrel fold metal-dependent hydrolase
VIPLIDTHQHLWDVTQFALPWLPDSGPLAGTHDINRYKREAAGCSIAATIYMEVDVAPEQRAAEAKYVIGLCENPDSGMVGATIGGMPSHPGFEEYIERFGPSPYVLGIRQVLHGSLQTSEFLSEPFLAGLRLLERHNLHFDLCLRPNEIWAAAELADACPGVKFVLDHCGNGEPQSSDRSKWANDIRLASQRENIICKVSGIVAGAAEQWSAEDLRPIIEHCAECFGPNRLVFGSDWPVCTLRSGLGRWVETLRSITSSWSKNDQHALYHRNAEEFYGLAPVQTAD